jgi:hypothetical protein
MVRESNKTRKFAFIPEYVARHFFLFYHVEVEIHVIRRTSLSFVEPTILSIIPS